MWIIFFLEADHASVIFCYSTHRGYAWYNTRINKETDITNEKNHSIISQEYLHLNIIHQIHSQEGAQIIHFCFQFQNIYV